MQSCYIDFRNFAQTFNRELGTNSSQLHKFGINSLAFVKFINFKFNNLISKLYLSSLVSLTVLSHMAHHVLHLKLKAHPIQV